MALILNLETATKNCSIGLSKGGSSIALVEEAAEKYIHSEKLHLFLEKALQAARVSFSNLDAIAVSNGPGSYTGLRIGISAAKGLCYALNIPLISLNTNDVLVERFKEQTEEATIFSVIDARRNEVFGRFYNGRKEPVADIFAYVLESGMFAEYAENELRVVGDAATKTKELLGLERVEVFQEFPSAKNMARLAEQKFQAKDFVNMAYHEPFYLKEFIAGRPKKLL